MDDTDTLEAASVAEETDTDEVTEFPPERYKGLQRLLDRAQKDNANKDEAIRDLQEQANVVPQATNVDATTLDALKMLHEHDPEGAKALATRVAMDKVRSENEELKRREQSRAQEAYIQDVLQKNLEQLRAMAGLAEVDPNSDMLDYGRDDEPIYERMEKLNRSINEAKVTAVPQHSSQRGTNEVHETQPGTPARDPEKASWDEHAAASRRFAQNPSPANRLALLKQQTAMEAEALGE